MSLEEHIWLRNNKFIKLDNTFIFPAQYECKTCYLLMNEKYCDRCSKKYFQKVRSISIYELEITHIRYI